MLKQRGQSLVVESSSHQLVFLDHFGAIICRGASSLQDHCQKQGQYTPESLALPRSWVSLWRGGIELTTENILAFLRSELERRREHNPAYSQRAFARDLGVAPGRMSEIMTGRYPISLELGERIARRLKLDDGQRQQFFRRIRAQRNVTARRPKWSTSDADYAPLSEDVYLAIADWYHYALLSLMDTAGFQSDEAWMARRLGLPLATVEQALARLDRLGLAKNTRGTWRPTYARLTTSHDVPSEALRRSHRQVLSRAAAALDAVSVDQRDVTSSTLAGDPARVPHAKEMIRAFRRQLARFLEDGVRTEVFDLNVQLIPVTLGENERGNGGPVACDS